MKRRIVEILKENKGKFISGQVLSDELDVSRTSISNHMKTLKEEGYKIESISRKGHKLISSPDILTKEELAQYLETDYIGRKIYYHESLESTNTLAKDLARENESEGIVVISEEQTSGRGRLGRNWTSPKKKGIWMSIVVKPNIEPIDASKITQITAASVYRALSEMDIETSIKWPNDIILNDKKICGILTEMSSEMMQINYMVVGIGINVNLDLEDLPEDLREKASSIKIETGSETNRKELVARILNNFEYFYNLFVNQGDISEAIDICRKKSILIGKEVRVIERDKEFERIAVDLTDKGELIVKDDKGNPSVLISGEVSVRGKHGYV